MIGEAVSDNVRRYRAIASLCRQAAAFRPVQKFSLLQQAEDWERLALIELEARFDQSDAAAEDLDEQVTRKSMRAGGCQGVKVYLLTLGVRAFGRCGPVAPHR